MPPSSPHPQRLRGDRASGRASRGSIGHSVVARDDPMVRVTAPGSYRSSGRDPCELPAWWATCLLTRIAGGGGLVSQTREFGRRRRVVVRDQRGETRCSPPSSWRDAVARRTLGAFTP